MNTFDVIVPLLNVSGPFKNYFKSEFDSLCTVYIIPIGIIRVISYVPMLHNELVKVSLQAVLCWAYTHISWFEFSTYLPSLCSARGHIVKGIVVSIHLCFFPTITKLFNLCVLWKYLFSLPFRCPFWCYSPSDLFLFRSVELSSIYRSFDSRIKKAILRYFDIFINNG